MSEAALRSDAEVVTTGPVTSGERIGSIDVLRGFALLGILVMNIQTFAMIGAAYFSPTAYGDLTGANWLVWLLSHVLADQKFMTIFSMLFGAGIVIMSERAVAAGRRPAALHYRRMLWLILFGLAHAHLLWYGDILYLYGMCGLVVYLFRRLPPHWLLILGLLSLLICSALWNFFGWSVQFWPPEELANLAAETRPDAAAIAEEVAIYQGGWWTQMSHRVPAALEFETFILLIWGGWRAGGLMLIGMAMFKLGVFSARRPDALYLAFVAVALLVGLPVVLFGVRGVVLMGTRPETFFTATQFNYWGSIAMSFGWVGLVMLACRAGWPANLLARLAAVGRMAFSLYILQTVIATTIFYGHGFGLFGRVDRVGQIAIVAAVTILQLGIAPLWLARFRFGPLEWLWRSLTYWRAQPMRVDRA